MWRPILVSFKKDRKRQGDQPVEDTPMREIGTKEGN